MRRMFMYKKDTEEPVIDYNLTLSSTGSIYDPVNTSGFAAGHYGFLFNNELYSSSDLINDLNNGVTQSLYDTIINNSLCNPFTVTVRTNARINGTFQNITFELTQNTYLYFVMRWPSVGGSITSDWPTPGSGDTLYLYISDIINPTYNSSTNTFTAAFASQSTSSRVVNTIGSQYSSAGWYQNIA